MENDELKSALEQKYPSAKFHLLVTPMPDGTEESCIVRLPIGEELWRMVREKQFEPSAAEKAAANRMLVDGAVVAVNGTVLAEGKKELRDALRRWPALVDVWAGEIGELAGSTRGTRREKF